ncbi:MAG: L-ectoine synthase [Sandaracinus sp.]|nr:L-ectoine synthase [Sandaracinus sp.]
MIVRKLSELEPERIQSAETWSSRRLVLAGDKMGFSMHDTIIHAGTTTHMHYANHLEAVYCIQGKGTVKVVQTGEEFVIEAGTIYALDQHDEHILTAESEMRMVCAFNPPLVGRETHDENGVYPLLTEDDEAAE